ncbi:MAG: hypothetical protein KGQ58_09455 [Proteobacteria bacterium]|nr:hypothetical protein [Pseudomonadota bacterium]
MGRQPQGIMDGEKTVDLEKETERKPVYRTGSRYEVVQRGGGFILLKNPLLVRKATSYIWQA